MSNICSTFNFVFEFKTYFSTLDNITSVGFYVRYIWQRIFRMDSKFPYPENTQPPAYQPGGQAYPPPAGSMYPPVSQPAGYASQPGQTTVIVTPSGNCPSCHVGHLVETYSICGILWLILCFPCGLICFLTMKDKKCGHCGYTAHWKKI